MNINSAKKYQDLRNQYSDFIYNNFSVSINNSEIQIVYDFEIGGEMYFNPKLKISIEKLNKLQIDLDDLNILAFHLGMTEMMSYWKSVCSPQIIIKPFILSDEQLHWWKKLFYHGLGEFFQTNQIITDYNSFVTFKCESEKHLPTLNIQPDGKNVLIPIGGGKDSNVSLELLKNHFDVIPFAINPRKAIIDSVIAAGFKEEEIFVIDRSIDPFLLELNAEGFLNGHTPFSAIVAFSSLIAAQLTNSKHIALSNESSANEPTDLESGVNHQYSKSYEFENDFRKYVENNISKEINYFSFLRPISEFQIAHLFSEMKKYHFVFRSCNVGSKKGVWCGKCSKCLFTYIILSPFLSRNELFNIFGNDLLDDPDLSM